MRLFLLFPFGQSEQCLYHFLFFQTPITSPFLFITIQRLLTLYQTHSESSHISSSIVLKSTQQVAQFAMKTTYRMLLEKQIDLISLRGYYIGFS